MDKSTIEIIALIVSALAAIALLVEYASKKKVKLLFATVSIFFLLLFVFSYFFKITPLSPQPQGSPSTTKDTIVSYKEQNDGPGNQKGQVTEIDNPKMKIIPGSKTDDTLKTEVPIKNELAEVVNQSMKVKTAVLATTNGKKDRQLADYFINWLRKYGSVSNSILLNSFIDQGYFDQILDDNTSIISKTNASLSTDFICVIRANIDYTQSETVSGVIMGTYSYEVVIIDSKAGKIIESFHKTSDRYPGVSEDDAKRNAESKSFNSLNSRSITI